MIRRRIAATKGLQDELDLRVHRENDVVTDISVVDGTATYDDKYLSANLGKDQLGLKVNTADVVDALDNEGTTVPLSANQGKVLKDIIDGLSGGLVYKGGFDASGDALPEDVTQGWLYKITVAGTIDGLEMAVNDTIFANKTVVGATAGTDWDKIDNTESPDILRDGDISLDADFTVDGTLLTDRTTIKNYVDDAVSEVSTKFTNESGTVASDKFTLANQPLDNCIFTGVASVDNGDGTFDLVECTVNDSAEVTLASETAGEYDDKTATVTYAYNA